MSTTFSAAYKHQTNWPGSRITGLEGVKLLGHFSQLASEKSLKNANEKLGRSYQNFQAWMSTDIHLEHFSKFNFSPVQKSFHLSGEELALRQKAFQMGKRSNIERVNPKQSAGMILLNKNDPEFEKFNKLAAETKSIISRCDFSWNARLHLLIHELLPFTNRLFPNTLLDNGSGLSTLFYRHGVFLSTPVESEVQTFEFCLNLAHEMGHQALMIYEQFDDIVKHDHTELCYSVIRRTERPVIQSFHALIATAYMVELIFCAENSLKEVCSSKYVKMRFEELRDNMRTALGEFDHINFTKFGKQIFLECKSLYLYSLTRKM